MPNPNSLPLSQTLDPTSSFLTIAQPNVPVEVAASRAVVLQAAGFLGTDNAKMERARFAETEIASIVEQIAQVNQTIIPDAVHLAQQTISASGITSAQQLAIQLQQGGSLNDALAHLQQAVTDTVADPRLQDVRGRTVGEIHDFVIDVADLVNQDRVTALQLPLTPQKMVPPPHPPGMSQKEFGQNIMKWGNQSFAVPRRRILTITPDEMRQAGVTKDMVLQWRDFYLNEAALRANNPSARGRADLMDHVYHML